MLDAASGALHHELLVHVRGHLVAKSGKQPRVFFSCRTAPPTAHLTHHHQGLALLARQQRFVAFCSRTLPPPARHARPRTSVLKNLVSQPYGKRISPQVHATDCGSMYKDGGEQAALVPVQVLRSTKTAPCRSLPSVGTSETRSWQRRWYSCATNSFCGLSARRTAQAMV